ncbi:MAG: hypothetical protein JGK24_04450 [Microcoleus sp. PH2017_29_MFU_D_A]|jgi:hypothetical protein|uniref:hypothetical protein n=1 Tax=unclassified Microcoleus TaxID=2642155 RepID=UPI001D3CBA13|nr:MULTISPECIES: hypothetical protein [unclassified Microcoleus]MCC3417149.1 hypothetical protein [Microcoleus sp. PH2017_07_MST_O_A]MCC3428617.1 hypothetical protein [Microcoleus sp. PH2017_04_SCI_O_A]TAG33010.1 MAG: hypothetical protein EAZ33_30520 [Oscillatoriales cyanobacterium]MCC3423292.1 hypothetical protein [Microcoleus sp. PH2017_01_SCD_O_A]MCC3437001.1 hypothetical protein [Microcoleus sp. PH2017_05_CCC_O_A]
MSSNESGVDESVTNQSALAKLLCGNVVPDGGEIDEVLSHLSASIDNVVKELVRLESLSDNQISLFAPFLGRSILELGCTALIARLDPFRVLLLREYQRHPHYQIDKPNKSSIHWQGDVLAKKVNNLWEDKSLENPTRALLGDYYKTLIWSANFDKLLDAIRDVSGDEWIVNLRTKSFERFYNETLNDFSSLYSELSKGIHHELVIPLSSALDRDTTQQLIEKTVRNIATLGLFVSVVSHAVNKLDIQVAITAYKEIQEMGVF